MKERTEKTRASSPYSRPPKNSTPQPSLLSGIITSFLSPFRSNRKPAASLTTAPTRETDPSAHHNTDVNRNATAAALTEYAIAALNGGDGSASDELDLSRAPPSPTPASTRPSTRLYPSSSQLDQLVFRGASVSSQHSGVGLDHFADSTPAPRRTTEERHSNGMSISPASRATEELARFFREKAERGDEPLTAIEQAGVYQLLQQAQAESSVPTAFTPNFKSGRTSLASPFFSPTSSQRPLTGSVSSNSIFGSPSAPAATPVFRRRRPIYVGAGYSSARRRKQSTAPQDILTGEEPMRRSQSDVMVYEMANSTTSVVEGKRRRIDEPEGISKSASSGSLGLGSAGATSDRLANVASQKVAPFSTPARPSPLWQVSQAATPSPPPKKPEPVVAIKPPTSAADLMLDIIRQEDASQPPKVVRADVINPYESSDNPIARIPRSRPARPATPRRSVPTKNITPAAAISPLEMLEQTMPAEYKRDDAPRQKVPPPSTVPSSVRSALKSAPPPPPTPTTKKAVPTPEPKVAPPKKSIEVIELSDSDDEEEVVQKPKPKAKAEGKKVVQIESEEEEEEEQEEDELFDDEKQDENESDERDDEYSSETEVAAPTPVVKKPTLAFAPPAPAPAPIFSKPAPPPAASNVFSFGAKPTGTPFAPSTQSPDSKTPPVTSTSSAFTFAPDPVPVVSSSTPPSLPSFTFSVPSFSSTSSISRTPLSDTEAKAEAIKISKTLLPKFSFDGVFNDGKEAKKTGEEESRVMKAVRDMVKGMSKAELPAVVL